MTRPKRKDVIRYFIKHKEKDAINNCPEEELLTHEIYY